MAHIKIGIIGCANIAERAIIPAIQQHDNFILHGVASRSQSKADEFAKRFETTPYNSYADLLSTDCDAVYIPLPNSMHYKWVKQALDTGKHVLVEKSLACTLAEVEELTEIARQNDRVLLENFQFRFHSQLAFILEQLSQGRIGELRLVRSQFGFPPFSDENNIRYQKSLGGGALLDVAAYPLKISQIILGNNLEITAAQLVTPEDKEVDIWGSASLAQTDGNLTAQIGFGFDHFYQNTLQLWGNLGVLTAYRLFTAGPGVEPAVTIESTEGLTTYNLPEDNHFMNMLNHFLGLINGCYDTEEEHTQNINQARLISDLYSKAND